jgi:AcrR family transcriptional regulator
MTPTNRRPARHPQQDRSRQTHQRVLEATVECLSELGWTGATVGVVAQRAGVSRGAIQHHFPTRAALVTAAIEHMSQVRLAQLQARTAALTGSQRRTEQVLMMLGELYTGPPFQAALQAHAAAATDPALREAVVGAEGRVNAETHRLTVLLLGADESVPGVRELVQASLDLLRGLALADVLTDDSRRRRRVLERWAGTLDAAIRPDGAPDPLISLS